jgi:hypothetical protein
MCGENGTLLSGAKEMSEFYTFFVGSGRNSIEAVPTKICGVMTSLVNTSAVKAIHYQGR